MSDEPAIGPTENGERYLAEFFTHAQTLFQSEQFRDLMDRFAAVVKKDPNRKTGGSSAKLSIKSGSNLLFSTAIHGLFIGFWSEFELLVETLIMRYSGMTAKNTSIVCSALQAGVKMQILHCLLTENGDTLGVSLLRSAQNLASRNIYVHGIWDANDDFSNLGIVHREAKSEYTVRRRKKDWHDTAKHFLDFVNIVYEIHEHFKLPNEDVANYKKSIVELVPVHASRAERRREPKTNSQTTK